MHQIEIKNLSKDYQVGESRINAVFDVNLKIKKGEFISIVGHSGSGKTTLISMIGGILIPSKGNIIVDGLDICTLDDNGLSGFRNKKIGFMFQFASLLPILSAKENILLPYIFGNGNGRDIFRKAELYLEIVGLGDKINSYPAELSGGQQRRVAIARALINEPEIILADEPTGDLDVETERDIMNLFKKLNRERKVTILMVTHNLALAKMAKRKLVMEHGKIKEVKK